MSRFTPFVQKGKELIESGGAEFFIKFDRGPVGARSLAPFETVYGLYQFIIRKRAVINAEVEVVDVREGIR